jgi:hypothetical protein
VTLCIYNIFIAVGLVSFCFVSFLVDVVLSVVRTVDFFLFVSCFRRTTCLDASLTMFVCLGMPTPTAFDNFNLAQSNSVSKVPAAPPEDKYAALKDLDNALKTQNAVDWNSSGSNGSLYSSPTPTGSMYSSPSPQSSMFGSPSQGWYPLHRKTDTSSAFYRHNKIRDGHGKQNLKKRTSWPNKLSFVNYCDICLKILFRNWFLLNS